ncbi:MAG TPA: hypothetical protein VFS44_06430 [Gemmatimonadaceae bacterium]|nr:hypothetical protein [Gemmatimonadaceae bacterium]
MTSSRALARVAAPVLWGCLLAVGALPAQDSTFLLSSGTPVSRFPAYLGNGRLGVRTSPLGTSATPSLLAGVYEHAPGDVPRIAALPAWNEVDVFDGRRWLGDAPTGDGTLDDYRQTLDMYDGIARTSYEWVDGSRRTAVEVRTFASRARPDIAVVRLDIVPRYGGRLRVRFTLRQWPEPRRLPLDTLERTKPEWGARELWYPGHMSVVRARAERPARGGATLWMTSRPDGRATDVAQVVTVSWPRDLAGVAARATTSDTLVAVDVSFDATAGTHYTFAKLASVATSKDGARPLERARAEAARASAAGYDALEREHAAAWHAFWATDIVVDGDTALQRVIHSTLFGLASSARAGTETSIPPMGLSTAGYYGHVFWDADTWMFPAMLLLHPDIARSMVMFRARTLDAARRNARANGFRGAMYPWEAGEHGEETTPHFAAQNASSEIHVTGDVALAQWQYYLATGDSAWLARYGYPVIRETAEFWVSRATHDTTHDRYDIRNVVSVDEGMIGIENDAYTNAVARRNLMIAADASRRLGVRADPRWREIAAKLYIPYDSAAGYHPTYEGAPDTTIGSVVPLLAFPLGVPMSERAKRTDLHAAVKQLFVEGGGAMMTETLYPVIAAELGERALVDSLLPLTYRPHLRGPFQLLAETPTNDAVDFVTGAGGFLQQILFGYTGLRLTDRGLERAYPPMLPSTIRRLTLRDVPLRGKRYDIVVEGDSLRIADRAPEEGARPAGRTVSPVLAFPDPALDDTAAYQGYETRFYRDSRGNTVQIYIDRRSGRVVHVWADAADESIGFTARDSTGRPAAVTWGADDALVADSGRMRTLAYRLAIASPSVRIGGLLLGSMRVERDFQYAKGHLKPFATPTFGQKELDTLIADLGRLAPDERQRQLALLHARSVGELRARLLPRIGCRQARGCSAVRIAQSTLDGRSHLVLDLSVDPREAVLGIDGQTITARSRRGAPIRLAVSIATDARALTPLAREEIFDRDFLRFLARERAAHDSVLRHLGSARPHGTDSATVARYGWLEREVRSVELLSTREKLMAGLPNFATYFGRDMMMAALMMRPIWSSAMSEHVIASVLRKLGPAGDVSHEEALGAQAIRENAAVYDSLIDAWSAHRRRGERAAADSALARARAVLGDLQRVRENYHMMDDEFQLPVLAARYLADSTVSASARRAFLVDTTGAGGESHLSALLRELALVATEAAPYARDPSPEHLIAFTRLDSAWWRSASWRDSRAGYANGRYAMDINVIWAPRALSSIADILESLRALGFGPQAIDSVQPSIARTPLAGYVRDPAAARRDADVWRGAERYFVVTLGAREVDARVRAKLAWLPAEERSYWARVMAGTASTRSAVSLGADASDSLAFLALSLDSAGHPIPVMNTDPATRLFLDGSATGPARDSLPANVVLRDAATFVRPYPVGLFVNGLGPLVANDAYASRRVWDAFAADAYHSPRVVWGREVNLIVLGLAGQIGAVVDTAGAPRTPALAPYANALHDALRRIVAAVDASGFKHSELWSYRIENGELRPIRYGTSSDIQLWSATDLAVQYVLGGMAER